MARPSNKRGAGSREERMALSACSERSGTTMYRIQDGRAETSERVEPKRLSG